MSKSTQMAMILNAIAELSSKSPGGVRINEYQGQYQATIYPKGINDSLHLHFEDTTLAGAVMKAFAAYQKNNAISQI